MTTNHHSYEILSITRSFACALADVPMGRGGRPEEVAALARFLLGDEGSYTTGQAVNIGGGYVTW